MYQKISHGSCGTRTVSLLISFLNFKHELFDLLIYTYLVDYARGQDAKILLTGKLTTAGPSLIALSPDSYSIAVSVNSQLNFYSALDGECLQTIENVANGSFNSRFEFFST